MTTSLVIIFLGLLIFGAHFFNALFDRTKIPNVLLLLLIGVVIGPVLGFVRPEHFGEVGVIFSTLTLIILLFESGINLRLQQLAQSIGSAFLLAAFNFLASAVIATLVAHSFTSLSLISATFFGIIVAGTSSAVVIPMINQLKMNQRGATILLLESALTDVLCLVIGLALLSSMKKGIVEPNVIISTIFSSFIIAMLFGIAGGIVWSLLLEKIRQIRNSTFMNLAFVFIVYGVTEVLGFNGGIATLSFGIALGNAFLFQKTFLRKIIPAKELLPTEKSFFAELVFILSTYFFVYVGVCIQFGNPLIYLLGLLIVAAIIAIRPLSIKVFIKSKEMTFKDLSIMAVMAPKGLVPAILASIPLQLGLAGGQTIQDLGFSVVLLSIVGCAILVIVLSRDATSVGLLKSLLLLKSSDQEEIEEEEFIEEIEEAVKKAEEHQ
ncbi:MAG: sodium:proton exchanger [Flavobacteriales bacterium]|nr:MAG: sodium:proton exchanger [Flavobacteriales bacterium]